MPSDRLAPARGIVLALVLCLAVVWVPLVIGIMYGWATGLVVCGIGVGVTAWLVARS